MAKKPKKDKKEMKYKDPYSCKEYETVDVFLAMKLSHIKTNFTKLYMALYEIVKAGKQEATISLSEIGLETMDARLPRYVLKFIKDGEKYKAHQNGDEESDKLILTKKK